MDTVEIEFSLNEVVEGLKQYDIDSFICRIGGGCATLYLGMPGGEGYYNLGAGPGNYGGADDNPVGYYHEFYIGGDEENPETPPVHQLYSGEKSVKGIVDALVKAYKA